MSTRNIQRSTSSRKTGGLLMGHDGLTGALWAVLYSPSQKAYHLSQIDEMLHRNQTLMAQGGITDYVPIFFSTSRAHASELCDMCKAIWGRPLTAQLAYRQRCQNMKTPTVRKLAGVSTRFARARLVVDESGHVLKDCMGVTRKRKGAKAAL